MSERIDAIAARVKAATAGPWSAVDRGDDICAGVASFNENIADVFGGDAAESNAAFIANAREDIPFLLAELSAATARMEKMERVIEEASELRASHGDLCPKSFAWEDPEWAVCDCGKDALDAALAALSPPTKPHGTGSGQ